MKKLIHIFLLFKILMTACVPKSTAVDALVVAPVDVATEPLDSPFLAINLTPAERAADLLARMTLEEKIGQMTLVEKDSISGDAVMQYFIGGVLSGGGGGCNLWRCALHWKDSIYLAGFNGSAPIREQ